MSWRTRLFGTPDRETLARGIPAVATVVSARESGMELNDQDVMDLRVRIDLPGHDPYETDIRQPVPESAEPAMRPGARVPVKVHPRDRAKAALDFRRAPDGTLVFPAEREIRRFRHAATDGTLVRSASAADEVIARLERLAALRAGGALSDDEFEAAKARLLERL